MMGRFLLSSVILCALTSVANATPIVTASLFTPLPPSGATLTPIVVNGVGITTPSQTMVFGNGYTITFNGEASTQGVVNGTLGITHAVPVAGVMNGNALYLTGDYNSAETSNVANSGNYLSSGNIGTVQISFATPQTSIALLWGSIDTTNLLTFSNGDTVTGTQVQLAAANFATNGFQGPGGSAYVSITDSPFTYVTLSTATTAFEAMGIAGSDAPFNVPEPISLGLLGISLAGLGLARHFKHS